MTALVLKGEGQTESQIVLQMVFDVPQCTESMQVSTVDCESWFLRTNLSSFSRGGSKAKPSHRLSGWECLYDVI